MKEELKKTLDSKISSLNMHIDDAYMSDEEGQKNLNIVLDSDEVIDLNRVTDASRIINKELDKREELLYDCDVLNIFSKEKGDK